jgi:threonine/homoserine/homoserine lactone efflux protein
MSFNTLALFSIAFFLLALAPGAGLAMILSRTLGSGLAAGFAVTAGLVMGDFIFMGIAAAGMSAIAQMLGPMFQVLKYLGAAYLIWLGYKALTAEAKPIELSAQRSGSRSIPLWREVMMGLLVTLGNPKPILFYSALMPTLMNISSISLKDYALLGCIVILISTLVYGAYMLVIEKARRMLLSARANKRLNQATGAMFIGSGIWVVTR